MTQNALLCVMLFANIVQRSLRLYFEIEIASCGVITNQWFVQWYRTDPILIYLQYRRQEKKSTTGYVHIKNNSSIWTIAFQVNEYLPKSVDYYRITLQQCIIAIIVHKHWTHSHNWLWHLKYMCECNPICNGQKRTHQPLIKTFSSVIFNVLTSVSFLSSLVLHHIFVVLFFLCLCFYASLFIFSIVCVLIFTTDKSSSVLI